jgi:hypothetical protein
MPLPRPSGTRHHRSGVPSIPAARERVSRAIRPTCARCARWPVGWRRCSPRGSNGPRRRRTRVRRDRQHVCVEVPVADDEMTKPAAVEVIALGGQGQQGRVDEQFLESVTDVAGGNVHADPLLHSDVLTRPTATYRIEPVIANMSAKNGPKSVRPAPVEGTFVISPPCPRSATAQDHPARARRPEDVRALTPAHRHE